MKQSLSYGKVRWSYEDEESSLSTRPTPIMTFCPIRIFGKPKYPQFTDKTTLALFKIKTSDKLYFREAYRTWFESWKQDLDLGEGRAFLRWLIKNQKSIIWQKGDFSLHKYFTHSESPKHDIGDEMSAGQSFAIKPVVVLDRKVKLYLQDEAVLNLISLPYGTETDFLELVQNYIRQRFLWEEWRAPAPPFIEWVKAQGKKPIFHQGQLGFHPEVQMAP